MPRFGLAPRAPAETKHAPSRRSALAAGGLVAGLALCLAGCGSRGGLADGDDAMPRRFRVGRASARRGLR